jgi:heme exporter protein B
VIRLAFLVARKDLLIERRSRVLLWQVAPFGLMTLVLCGLAVGPDAVTQAKLAPGLFYIVMTLVSLLVINRTSQVESSRGTATSVQILGIDPGAVFLGKAFAMAIQLSIVGLAMLAGTTVLLHVPLRAAIFTLPVLLLASITLSFAGILYGRIAASSENAGTLLPALALPAFAPVLIAGERAFSSFITPGPLARWVWLLGVALAAYACVGLLLYGALEET